MSLLKTSQAQANEKFFLRQENSASEEQAIGVHSTKNSVSMSQAFMSQSQIQAINPPSTANMHTAMRLA